MRHFALLIAAALLMLAPQALRAHDYEDATMRFTVPDDYTYQAFNNETQGITGFTAEKAGVQTTLFRFSTNQRIDRSSCLSQRDDKWLPSLAKLPLISQSTPLWKRYDKVSDYRTDKGYLRVYRYVDRKGIGFLVAESKDADWEHADRIASGQRYKVTAGYLLDRGWYLLSKLLGYLALAFAGLYVIFALRENARNTRMWTVLLLIAIAGGLLIWFEPFFGRKLWMIVTAITLGVCVSAFDGPDSDSSGDDGDSGGGYDGTGTTIHYDV